MNVYPIVSTDLHSIFAIYLFVDDKTSDSQYPVVIVLHVDMLIVLLYFQIKMT